MDRYIDVATIWLSARRQDCLCMKFSFLTGLGGHNSMTNTGFLLQFSIFKGFQKKSDSDMSANLFFFYVNNRS